MNHFWKGFLTGTILVVLYLYIPKIVTFFKESPSFRSLTSETFIITDKYKEVYEWRKAQDGSYQGAFKHYIHITRSKGWQAVQIDEETYNKVKIGDNWPEITLPRSRPYEDPPTTKNNDE